MVSQKVVVALLVLAVIFSILSIFIVISAPDANEPSASPDVQIVGGGVDGDLKLNVEPAPVTTTGGSN